MRVDVQMCKSVTMNTTATRWLTTEQAATRLGTTTSTVNRWVNQGKITPAFQAPGRTGTRFYALDDVTALQQNGSAQ